MIDGLKPYPAMKDSGVPWIGRVPSSWDLERMKFLYRERNEKGYPEEPLVACTQSMGVVRKTRYGLRTIEATQNLELLKLVRVGDFVIGLQSFEAGIEYAHDKGIISPAYTVLQPKSSSVAEYGRWLLKSSPFIDHIATYATGIRQGQSVAYDRLGRSYLPTPPAADRSAISVFLDHADRRIRRYIRAKQKLIKLLEEQNQAIIHRAVTRGLDPNVRLKASGVEWLGDVPEHWDLMRVKQVTRVLRGKFTHRPRNDPSLYDGQYPFIQTGEVARAGKSITSFRQTLNQRGLAVSKLFPAGTLVMTIAANIGDVAILDFDACFPDSVVGFVPRARVDRDFLYYLFVAMKPELLREAPVNTQGNLNVDRIGARAIALPPETEQQAIVRWIEASCASLTGAVEKAGREVSLLREYRTRLIADVVTGKLDVREAVAWLPQEAEDHEPLDEAEPLGDTLEVSAADDLDAEPEEAEA